jgi:hypothetical protein
VCVGLTKPRFEFGLRGYKRRESAEFCHSVLCYLAVTTMSTKGLVLALVSHELCTYLEEVCKFCHYYSANRLRGAVQHDFGLFAIRVKRCREREEEFLTRLNNKVFRKEDWLSNRRHYHQLARYVIEFWEYTDPYDEILEQERHLGMDYSAFKKGGGNSRYKCQPGYTERIAEVKRLNEDVGLFVMHGATERLKDMHEDLAYDIMQTLHKIPLQVYPLAWPTRIMSVICSYDWSDRQDSHLCAAGEYTVPDWAKPFAGEYDVVTGRSSDLLDENTIYYKYHNACYIAIGKRGFLQDKDMYDVGGDRLERDIVQI